MSETGIIILLAAIVAAFIFFDRYDGVLLRLTHLAAARLGAWFGAECLPLARKGNALGRPLAVIATVALVGASFARGDEVWAWFYAILASLWVTSRWFLYEPKLIARTAREQQSHGGALSIGLWREKYTNRKMAIALVLLWLPGHHTESALAMAGECGLFAALLCSLSVAYLISIEQPPYEHVKLRDRIRAMVARPVGGEA